MINMTQILALTGGGGNGGRKKKKKDVLLVYLNCAHRRKWAWMLQPGLCISKQRGAAIHLPPEFQLSFGWRQQFKCHCLIRKRILRNWLRCLPPTMSSSLQAKISDFPCLILSMSAPCYRNTHTAVFPITAASPATVLGLEDCRGQRRGMFNLTTKTRTVKIYLWGLQILTRKGVNLVRCWCLQGSAAAFLRVLTPNHAKNGSPPFAL